MHPELRTLLYDAEIKYLQTSEVELFRACVTCLQERLQTYECLRDQEIAIFQPIADEILKRFPEKNPELLSQALKHWISVLRYCAMAMLLNNPDFLQYRLIEWLAPLVQAHQMESLEDSLGKLLLSRLEEVLSEQQLALVHPFVEQARTTFLDSKVLSEVSG